MLLSGTTVANQIHQELTAKLQPYLSRRPKLVALLVGDNPASHLYVSSKIRACEKVGFTSDKLLLPSTTPEAELLRLIDLLNNDSEVTGILVQLPLPEQIDPLRVANFIDPNKDVDGISPVNYGRLMMGDPAAFVPCTPLGIQCLLERYQIPTEGRHVVIAGRSNIVGKPLASLLMQKGRGADATVTVVHSHTSDIAYFSRQADILVAAIGQARYFTADMIKEGAVVIDVGQNRIPDSASPQGLRLVGDVDFDAVRSKCSAITPVPGGVGPMTIAMLLSNTFKAFEKNVV